MNTTCKIILPVIIISLLLSTCKEKEDPCILSVEAEAVVGDNQSFRLAAVINDGLAPFIYSWSPGNSTDSIITVAKGDARAYSVTVTDNLGCTASATYTACNNFHTYISYSYVDPEVKLSAECDAIHGLCGLSPLTYSWSTGSASSTIFLDEDTSGTFSVTVTDARGCTVSASYTLSDPCGCLNGGTCVNGTCQCPSGFSGDSCQNVVVPVSLTINSVKVTFIPPLFGGWREWDDDSTKADLRLSINTNTSSGTTDGFYTSQIFSDASAAPVTFQSDFPYLITNLDTFWAVNLFDDDSPDNPEHMGGVSFVPDNHFASADSITLQTPFPNTPRYTLYIRWNY